MRHHQLKQAIDQARRAQLDQQGGYSAVEADARAHERQIRREAELAPKRIADLETRLKLIEKERRALKRQIKTSETRNADLSRRLKLATNRLSAARKSRDYWYTHATGQPADKGRGAARTRLRAVA